MSVKVEKKENNMATLTIEVSAQELEQALENAYQRSKGRITVPGFRKGKAPRKMIERVYGEGTFYEDAANELVPTAYRKAAEECGERIVSNPQYNVVQIESGLPFIFTAEVALRPEVKLGKYKGVSVNKVDTKVTAKEVTEEIDRVRELNGKIEEVTDRAVKDKDMVKLDFEGFLDGVPFEGGKGEDHMLTIGSGQFIPGFEEQLIGMAIGEEKEITVTFPEEYQAEELKGKEAVFKCKINSIRTRVLPKLDEEYVSDFTEFETVEEYKKDVEKQLKEKKETEARRVREDEAVTAIIEDSEIELPEPMIQTQQESILSDMDDRLRMQGMNVVQYAQMMGSTIEALKEQVRPQAISRIKARLVLEEIVEKEGIEVTDEMLEQEVEENAKRYGMTKEVLKERIGARGLKQLREDIAVNKAADFVVDNLKDKRKTKKKEEEA